MNVTLQAECAYGARSRPLKTHRGIEAELLTKITRDMMSSSQGGRREFGRFVSALHENRQLWIALAADVSSAENRLPKDVRAKIFYLAEFVITHTRKALKGVVDADVLVEINTSIMRGLNSENPAK